MSNNDITDNHNYHLKALDRAFDSNYVTIYIDIDGEIQIQKITFEMFILLSKVSDIYDKIDRIRISKKNRENLGCINECDGCIGINIEKKKMNNPPIEYIPSLPKNLRFLEIHSTEIIELPELPESLTALICINNKQLSTVKNIPNSIVNLVFMDCNLKYLPNFPENVEYINLNNNYRLENIPQFPIHVNYISCDNCGLQKLPKLPNSIEHLSCSHNEIRVLPDLPASLSVLYCDNNKLIELPKLIHLKRMIRMDCSFNQISYTPSLPSLPNSKYIEINFSHNKLKILPYNLIDIIDNMNDIEIIEIMVVKYFCNRYIDITENPIAKFICNLDSVDSDKPITKDILILVSRYYTASNIIGNAYLQAKYNPEYKMCKDKVEKTYTDTFG